MRTPTQNTSGIVCVSLLFIRSIGCAASVSNTTTKFQNILDNYINGLTVVNTNLSTFINDLLAVADESDYNYVDQSGSPITLDADNAQTAGVGFANYIN